MSLYKLVAYMAIAFAALIIVSVITYFVVKAQKRKKYPKIVYEKWLNIQRLCANKDTWTTAVANADVLLGQALKRMRFKGKSIGERLVAAQRKLSDNDGVWYAHNLAKKLKTDSKSKLRESDVKKALIGFRQALRDIGALHDK